MSPAELVMIGGIAFVVTLAGGMATAWIDHVPMRIGVYAAIGVAAATACVVTVCCTVGSLVFGGAS